jgi:hypothetical protein
MQKAIEGLYFLCGSRLVKWSREEWDSLLADVEQAYVSRNK